MSRQDIRKLLELVKASWNDRAELDLSDSDLASADWSFIIATARRHRLSTLLYEAIRRCKRESSLASSVWGTLNSDYYTNLARNLILLDHLEALSEASRARGIPVLLLKGAAFAGWIYRNPALRSMSDLDVLVRGRDLDALTGIAETLGYAWYGKDDHAVSFKHVRSGTHLELHTSLTTCPQYLSADTNAMFERSVTAPGRDSMRTMTPEDHLLHICLHGSFQHGLGQPAINTCDTYLLSRLPELDWETFLKRASTPRLAPLVYGGLGLCQSVLPNEKVHLVLEELEPLVSARQKRWVEHLDVIRLVSPSPKSVAGSPWRRILWTPRLKDAWELVLETLRPQAGDPSTRWSSIGRGLTLFHRHALSRWSRAIANTGV
jgi:hypothetical protein